MSKRFDSVLASRMGDFVRSPLGVRDTVDISNRAVYTITVGADFDLRIQWIYESEKIFRLSLSNLTEVVNEIRPPWWPSPRSEGGQDWVGDCISGDTDTIWYSALNVSDLVALDETPRPVPLDQRWTIDIYKLNSRLEAVDSWRWNQPELGGGRVWHITPFGDSTVLWGLARVGQNPAPIIAAEEMYLVELDPSTMEIRRVSSELLLDFPNTGLTSRRFIGSGGGTADIIWLSWQVDSLELPLRAQAQIIEYDPTDFRRIRITDGPRSEVQGNGRRQIRGIGGDSKSIWLAQTISGQLGSVLSELPRNFTNENLTIIQDEVDAPIVEEGQYRFTNEIG